MESSLIKKIKNDLVDKTKKIKRLQARNRYLRKKMNGLKDMTGYLSEAPNKKSQKARDNLTQIEDMEESGNQR